MVTLARCSIEVGRDEGGADHLGARCSVFRSNHHMHTRGRAGKLFNAALALALGSPLYELKAPVASRGTFHPQGNELRCNL